MPKHQKDASTPSGLSIRVMAIGILLALVLLLAAASGSSLFLIRAHRNDVRLIEMAAHQTALAERMSKEAWAALSTGVDTARLEDLHKTVHEFEEGLSSIRRGSTVGAVSDGLSLPTATEADLLTHMDHVQATWVDLHQTLHESLNAAAGGSLLLEHVEKLDLASERLFSQADSVVQHYRQAADVRVGRLMWLQVGFLVVGVSILAIGLRVVVARLLRPLRRLEAAAGRIEHGDLDAPVDAGVGNELGHLAHSLDRMRRDVKSRSAQQRALLHCSSSLIGLDDPQELMEAAARIVQEALGAQFISIRIPDATGRWLDFVAGSGWEPETADHSRVDVETSREGQVFRTGEPLAQPDLGSGEPLPRDAELREQGVVSSITAPIRFEESVLGTVTAHFTDPRSFTRGEASFLSLIANQVAVAYRRRRDRKKAVEARDRYRDLFEGVPVGLYHSTPEGRLLEVNQALVDILGYPSREALLEVGSADLYKDPDDRARWCALLEEEDEVRGFEAQAFRYDGSVIWLDDHTRAVRDAAGRVVSYEGSLQDITERKTLEAQLRHRQKMEAVGTLTGGIAHDFNNILAVVLANAELLATLPADEEEHRELMLEMEGAARRGAGLIRQLMTFSRREEMAFALVDLPQAVREVAGVLRRTLTSTIEVTLTADDAAGTVRADPSSIQQILLNLGTNAQDAMPQGGTLHIDVGRATLDESHQSAYGWGTPGEYVRVAVSDSGIGMDRETRERIFEPFFTTKPSGKGTGLGLAMVYGLVKRHGGYLDVYSHVGRGTTFKLYFPVVGESPGAVAEPHPEEIPCGTETILLAEDEPAVRRSTRRALQSCGYRVLEAGDGREALEMLLAHRAEIDLVVSDLDMPHMGGRGIYDAARAEGLSVPFIFSSGYMGHDLREAENWDPPVQFLAKPSTVAAIRRCVRETLDRARGARGC